MKKLIFIFLLIPLISISQTFCDGWGAGYQKRLKSCMKVGLTPTCPLPNINADTYSDGYGLGYAKALEKCNEQTSQYDSSGGYQNPTYGVTDYNAFSRGFNQAFNPALIAISQANNNRRKVNRREKKKRKLNKKLDIDRQKLRDFLIQKVTKECKKNQIEAPLQSQINIAINDIVALERYEYILINPSSWKYLKPEIKNYPNPYWNETKKKYEKGFYTIEFKGYLIYSSNPIQLKLVN